MGNFVKINQFSLFFAPLTTIFYRANLMFSTRVFLCLLMATFVPWYCHRLDLVIPTSLGVLGAIVSDIDDSVMGRIRNLIVTSICFLISSFSIEVLFPHFWPFLLCLVISTFIFTILGVIGPRFSVVAFGSLLVASYTMIGYNSQAPIWQQPLYLMLGVLLYNGVTLIESLFFANRAAENAIATCFYELSNYLNNKSMLFDPDEQEDFKQQILTLAQNNRNLIQIVHQTKIKLFNRLGRIRNSLESHKLINYFFVIQSIHEHASATHVHYAKLTYYFKHSDLLFRIARILSQQALSCVDLGNSIRLQQPYLHNSRFVTDFIFLRETIEQIEPKNKEEGMLVHSLWNLFDNLQAIDALLANINEDSTLQRTKQGYDLAFFGKISFREKLKVIKLQFTIYSDLFRHAARISLVLGMGYIVIHLTQLAHGYWIIMTSLIVCQPNATTTKNRLKLRVIGTLLGSILGLPMLYLFPNIEAQLFLIALNGCLFFSIKNTQYAFGTIFLTLMVFFSFSLVGESTTIVALYRIIATIIGCGIAYLGVTFLWPDWKYNNLSKQINELCFTNSHYISLVGNQYLTQDANDLNYILARNGAYEADIAVFNTLNLLINEVRNPTIIDNGFRLLMLNHSLLGFISSLGAHRQVQLAEETLTLFDTCAVYIITALNRTSPISTSEIQHLKLQLEDLFERIPAQHEKANFLVIQQLQFILDLLPEFLALVHQFLGNHPPKIHRLTSEINPEF